MLPFLVGASCIVAPQYGFPVAAAAGILKAAKKRLVKKDQLPQKEDIEKSYETFAGPSQSVILQFNDLKCTLATKSGTKKQILKGVSGEAKVRANTLAAILMSELSQRL